MSIAWLMERTVESSSCNKSKFSKHAITHQFEVSSTSKHVQSVPFSPCDMQNPFNVFESASKQPLKLPRPYLLPTIERPILSCYMEPQNLRHQLQRFGVLALARGICKQRSRCIPPHPSFVKPVSTFWPTKASVAPRLEFMPAP